MTQQAAQHQLMRHHRPLHAERTAQIQAAFFLPLLRPGMSLLDLGCGPGTITTGLAAAVAPGPTTGVDIDPVEIDGVEVTSADVMSLPFPTRPSTPFSRVLCCSTCPTRSARSGKPGGSPGPEP